MLVVFRPDIIGIYHAGVFKSLKHVHGGCHPQVIQYSFQSTAAQ